MNLHLNLHNGDQADIALETDEVVFSHASVNSSLDTDPIVPDGTLSNGDGFLTRKLNVLEKSLLNENSKLQKQLTEIMAVKLEPGEPFFVLKGRDPQAPDLIRSWIRERELMAVPFEKKESALTQLNAMIKWKQNNPAFGVSSETYAKYVLPKEVKQLSYDVACVDPGVDYRLPYSIISFMKHKDGLLVRPGCTNESVLTVLIDRLTLLDQKFPCEENKEALEHVSKALEALERRFKKRTEQGIVGAQIPHVS